MRSLPITPTENRLPGVWALLADQVRYHLHVLLRTPRAIFAGLLLPGVLLALNASRGSQPTAQLQALVAGLSTLGVISTAYLTHATSLVAARESGVLRRWRATPLPAWCFFSGRIAATVALAIAGACVTVAAGVMLFGLHAAAGATLSLLAVVTLGALAWAAVGTAVTAVIPTVESASPLLSVSYLPIILLSGMFGNALSGEPDWLTTVIRYLPAQPMIDAADAVFGHMGPGPAPIPGRDLATLAVWAVAGLVASLRLFQWDPHRPVQRRSGREAGEAGGQT